jgi:DNA excision repair protein ERCC-3
MQKDFDLLPPQDDFTVSRAPEEAAAKEMEKDLLAEGGEPGAEALEKDLHSFEIDPEQVEHVKQRCLQPGELCYPMLEEYDFRNDTVRAVCQLRHFWQSSTDSMF